jgi:hypothetical protein
MLTLLTFNLIPLAAALAIGILTGWWAFRRPSKPEQSPKDSADS